MDKLPADIRSFEDSGTARNWMMDNALTSVKNRFPVEDNQFRLELHNPHYGPTTEFGLQRQKKALLNDEYLKVPIKGDWRLIDKGTNQVLDQRKNDTVMHVPYLTDRGTFCYNGNEYAAISQSRLKAGVYTRKRRSGEYEAFYNIKPGTGSNFRVWMEPQTGIFRVNIRQSNTPLYPLLKTLGVDDKHIHDTWGQDIYDANVNARAPQALDKLYERFAGYKKDATLDPAGREQALRELISKYELDPTVVARNLGLADTNRVTPAALVRTSQKLLNISRGKEEPDDRDHPMYSNVLSVEDLVKEPIDKDAGKLTRNLLFRLRRDRSLKRFPSAALNPYMRQFLLGSRLTQPLEETNPLHLLEQQYRITKLGEGGISSDESVTDEAREVNNGQAGFIDPVHGPEHTSVGIDVRAAYKTYKGKDNKLYGEFKDAKTGKTVLLTPEQAADSVIEFPHQDPDAPKRAVIARGKLTEVPKGEVTHVIPTFEHMSSPHSTLNPLTLSTQAARMFYSIKFWSQYMPQMHGEAPLVDSAVPGTNQTFSQYWGRKVGGIAATTSGTVVKVTPDEVVVVDQMGKKHSHELVQNFPFNRLTGVSYTPVVEPGATVKDGDLLASSSFTTKDGSLALGRNLNVAVIPYHGQSHDDSYVISEAAAQKMATNRLYGFDQDARHGVEINRNKYMSLFSDKFTKEQLDKLDENGITKPGTVLQHGDPIILAVGPKLLSAEDVQLGRLHKALRASHVDKAVIWEHEYPGTVADAVMTRSGAKVNVTAGVPMDIGDKISSRFAIKGTVGSILPDSQMPRNPVTNQPYDVLLNPMTVLSRVAASQMIELQLGKVARKTGQPIVLPQDPPKEGWTQFALNKLKEAGMEEDEEMFDPTTGKKTPKVMTGVGYFAAFHHLAEKKLSGRGASGYGYTVDQQPAKGGGATSQSKRMSQQDMWQLLAHGVPGVIRDAQVLRGAKNEEFWQAFRTGLPLPPPHVPFIYDKFINLMKAGGINVNQQNNKLTLLPMTDDDIKALSHGELASGAMVDYDFKPIKGGLFDEAKAGSFIGKNWTHIKLAEPVPNPVFEEPIRRLLGLTKNGLTDVLTGRQELDGKTGGAALEAALGSIDIDKAMAKYADDMKTRRGAQRDNAVKCYAYLDACKHQGKHPAAWIIHNVPVIPPVFRPISQLGDVTLQADINELYRDVAETNSAIKDLRGSLGDKHLASEKQTLYDAVKAAYGLGESITPEGKAKRLRGALWQIMGDIPKRGLMQARVLSKSMDTVGRAVASPDPNLDMDHIGIPEDMGWKLYKDFVLRHLVRRNIPVEHALEMIEKRDPVAKQMLDQEMQTRPVIVDRAPTWHKFNLLSFYPHLVKGDVIRCSPLIDKGFNLDFDGDSMNFHVPVLEQARKEAIAKMLPSSNLFSLTDLQTVRHGPEQEMALGLYLMSRPRPGQPVIKFPNRAAALAAYHSGKIKINDPVEIG